MDVATNVWNLKIINMPNNDFILLKRLVIEDKEMCEMEMYGGTDDLLSLVYSAMKSNEKFSEVILQATEAYLRSNYSKEAILN
jgi:hypothetical protein